MSDPKRCEWVPRSGGAYADYAVHAGIDSGNALYVARASHEGAIIPGKLHVTHQWAYIPYNMKEVAVTDYEVLIAPPASLSWVRSSGGSIPDNAVLGGQDTDGEKLYIGRALHQNTVTVGKIHPSHGTCYVAYDGEELSFTEYEILVKNAYGVMLGV